MSIIIELPWPKSNLAGHNTGHWRSKSKTIKNARLAAHYTTHKAIRGLCIPNGDIITTVTFYPPNRRGDRLNYPNRMKPFFDGMASGMCVNDKRFAIPTYITMEPSKNPRVEVEIHNITKIEVSK